MAPGSSLDVRDVLLKLPLVFLIVIAYGLGLICLFLANY